MEKLEFRATFYYLLEKSDHDGYCSGEECNYSEEVITYPYPSLISSFYHPTIKSSGLLTNIDANEWLGYLPNEKINLYFELAQKNALLYDNDNYNYFLKESYKRIKQKMKIN